MCGICGVVADAGVLTITGDLVERMRDTMIHRGPDGAGSYLHTNVGLGHRRLSIVDVEHGQQPMLSSSERYALVFNGEIFNHPMLKPSLEAEGARYRTRSDTETILHLVERYGDDAVTHLRGMFAIALWDTQRRRLWLARDRFGVKPLYYVHRADGSLWFASEIKALVAGGAIKPTLNTNALPDYLANHAPSGEQTLFEGVRRLPAGHTLVWQDGKIEIRRYWDLSFPSHVGEEPSATRQRAYVDEYLDRLSEAVRLRLMSDVPLGMFLSGGIDSAAITAIMSKMVDGPVKTFSVAFAEREANELHYARMVSEHCRTDHHEVVLSPETFFQRLPKLIWHEDEPLAHPSSVALHAVSQLASEHVKVVLSGEGSDETLAGYNRYRVTMMNARWGDAYERTVPRFARQAVRAGIRALPPGLRLRQRAERTFVMRDADLDALYFDNFAVFDRQAQLGMLSPGMREQVVGIDIYDAYHAALKASDATSLLDRLLYADTKTYLQELLMKQDQMSMAASIESRVPFLDHPLVEWVAKLPHSMKLRGLTTKWILREAMKPLLPAPILERGKMGFPVPVGAWFRGAWKPLLQELVLSSRALDRGIFLKPELQRLVHEHVAGVRNHSERLWSLVTLELWHRIFIDGDGANEDLLQIASPRRAA